MMEQPLSKGERSRQKVIRTAMRLVARHGFADTSFQMIGDACGLTQSAVIYHFKSKYGLFEALVKTIIEDNHELVAGLMKPEDDAATRLLKHCRGNVMWALKYRQDGQILILLYYLASFEARFADILEGMLRTGRERLLVHLLAGQREGLFSFRSDPARVAETLQDSLFGAMFYAAAAPPGSVSEVGLDEKWRKVISALAGAGETPAQPRA